MLKRIERGGEVSGIVSYIPTVSHAIPVDGGQIVYFLDTGKPASLKFRIGLRIPAREI